MGLHHLLSALLVLSTISAGSVQRTSDDAIREKFVGHWRLLKFVNFDASGAEHDAGFEGGRILYDAAGHMSAQLLHRSRDNFIAYYGRYTIDTAAAKVTHHVEGSTQAHWIGTDLVRYYEFTPNGHLKLSLRNAEGRATGTLTWERLR